MGYTVKVDETFCDVSVYRNNDICEETCNCDEFVGSFSFEKVNSDVVVHSWSFRDYDWDAAKIATRNFFLKWVKTNSIQIIYVERSEADRFWMDLGWYPTGKCEMLVRRSDECP